MKTNKLILFFLILGLMFLFTCKKVEKQMLVTTGTVSNILTTSADVSGEILDLGEGATQHGHCYSTSTNPTVTGTKTEKGIPSIGNYTSTLAGLQANTKYYVKAYISRGANVIYGSEISFITASDAPPVLTTTVVSSVTKTTAVSGGNITSEGGTPVTARGVCWSLATSPTISLTTKTSDGSGTGSFSSSLTGLTAGTKYYVRAYATNSGNTAYGSELNFTTSSDVATPPIVTTAEVTSITATSAICGGNVTSEGGSSVTIKGVCWGTSANPTTSNFHTDNGTGPGSYVSNLGGLNPGTEYHVRAYATNASGTSYGSNEYTFTTLCIAPSATTNAASGVSSSAATLNGTVNANGFSTTVSFEYGINTIYGTVVAATPGSVTGNSNTAVSMVISSLSPNTLYHYRVKTSNCGGAIDGNDQTFLTSTVPGAPTIGTATKGNAQATITFTAPASDGGSAITGYTATSNPGGLTGTGTISPVTVTGLTNGTAYTFTVTATNANGTGPASAASNSVTPSAVPGAPTIGTATKGNTQTIVTFTPPASNGGSAITGYTATSNPGSFTGTGASSPITVTGLTNGTAYTFTVTATNVNGTGPASAASNSVTPSTVPGAPTIGTATKGNAQAIVAFTPPTSDGGSAITGYTATSSPGGITGTGSTSPITVTGLTNGTAYTFTVTATNANGPGPASAASNLVTPSTVPGAPTSISATKGNTQAIVTFTPPASDGGSAITGYTATSNPGGFTGTSATSPITVTGLTNGTSYTFTVTATNANGTGPASSASNSVTPSTIPGAPTIGTATKGDAQANVSFTAPSSDGGSAITGYTATSNPGGKTGTGSTSPVTVTGLTNGTAYTFIVTASNVNGPGPASSPSNSVTPSTVPGPPTIGTATAGDTQANVSFTAPVSNGGSAITGYTVTSNPGNKTGTGITSPITVTGLTNGTAYTFTVVATNINGNSASSAPSNSVITGTVTNPTTGKIWMDKNLGASQVATSSTDAASYGDLYQWGRLTDGHQIRTSITTTALSSSNTPGHPYFILIDASPWDWRSPQNDNLWQGVTGTNNPCPTGYRLPTDAEWNAERLSWSTNNSAGAYASPLKLPVGGGRNRWDGSITNVGSVGLYWSSTLSGTNSGGITFSSSLAYMSGGTRAFGNSVRCIKD
jgi:uncharacterized protein (TIGR02145 family)